MSWNKIAGKSRPAKKISRGDDIRIVNNLEKNIGDELGKVGDEPGISTVSPKKIINVLAKTANILEKFSD